MKSLFFLFLIIIIKNSSEVIFNDQPAVNTNDGDIVGVWKLSNGGRMFASYEGIPYAKPPIKDLRFKDPQPVVPWSGVLNATKTGSHCLQYDPLNEPSVSGEEDCLFLNVYVPRNNVTEDMPVLVHLHAGAFMFGFGDMFGPELLMDKDVVVVTINYRLGPFGFLSTGDHVVPGNMGLKDQSLALKWIQRNIKAFRGDKNSVTIMGLSAGGASVHFHMLSRMSAGTFHKAFAVSGSAFEPWAQARNAPKKAKTIAQHLGCPTNITVDMVDCLRQLNGSDIVYAQTIFLDWKIKMFAPFLPVSEPSDSPDPFIADHPYHLAKSGQASKVPFITTVVGAEGLYPAALYQRNPELLTELEQNWEKLAANIFIYEETVKKEYLADVANRIKYFYMDGRPVSQETFPQLVQALSDRHFVADCGRSALIHAQTTGQPTYVYKYLFRGANSLSEPYAQNKNDYGASHADDSFHIGYYQNMVPIRKDDMDMSNKLIDMVYSFMATGEPKINGSVWYPVKQNLAELDYLLITNPTKMEMASSRDFGNESFWSSLGFNENENQPPTNRRVSSDASQTSGVVVVMYLSIVCLLIYC